MNKTNQHSTFERILAFACVLSLLGGAIYLVMKQRAEEIAAANELAHAKEKLQTYHYDLVVSYNTQLQNELLMAMSELESVKQRLQTPVPIHNKPMPGVENQYQPPIPPDPSTGADPGIKGFHVPFPKDHEKD